MFMESECKLCTFEFNIIFPLLVISDYEEEHIFVPRPSISFLLSTEGTVWTKYLGSSFTEAEKRSWNCF